MNRFYELAKIVRELEDKVGAALERIQKLESGSTYSNKFKEEIRDFATTNADTSTQLQLPLQEQPKP